MSIHILDDDSLLHLFSVYRPPIFDGDEDHGDLITGGKGWERELWWYTLTHVCQRWRNLIFGSTLHLGLCLVCTWGTPVADMLAHSPPLPLVIDYPERNRVLTAEDEEGLMLALEQRDRVRRIRLDIPFWKLRKFIVTMDEEYPMLEYLIVSPSDEGPALMFPDTLQAPHLLQLTLIGFVIPIGSRLLTTAVGIVTLSLFMAHPSTQFQLQWITFMPQLETLTIISFCPVPNRDVERQLMHMPIAARVTLPNLRTFIFRGVSAYLEEVLRRIITPRLAKLGIDLFNQLTFSIPRLVQFVDTTENLRFNNSEVGFLRDKLHVRVYREEDETYILSISIFCWHLDWQVSFVAQFFNSRSQISPAVENLALYYDVHDLSSEEHNEVDRAEWHELLKLFNKVKTLRVDDGLVKEVSRCLRPDDGESPPELLPELQELTYSGSGDTGDVFTPFINARQKAGRPVNLVRSSSSSVTPSS